MANAPETRHPQNLPSPDAIFELATGYWASAAVLTANSIGLFKAIQAGHNTAAKIAKATSSDQRAVSMLLDVCAGLGLLEKSGESYSLPAVSSAYLTPGSPGYLGGALDWSLRQYDAWGKLGEAVKTGRPVSAPELHLGEDPARTRVFVLAMHERAKGIAHAVVDYLELGKCKKLLDVGGGPGTFSVAFAKRYTGMSCDVIDLPGVAAIATELIAEAGVSDRVRCIPGDATKAEYGKEKYDAVLFCGVLHQMSGPTIQKMIAAGHKALTPGGRLVVCDMMVDASKTGPLFCALFSLQMLLTSREGAAFSSAECESWMAGAGLKNLKTTRLPQPLPYTVIIGSK